MDESVLGRLRKALLEEDCPFFTDEELEHWYTENDSDFNETAYQCLILKSLDTTLSLNGVQMADTSKYFRRLAARYRRSNSGTLKQW